MARFDRLGPAPKETAQIGAVLGREFSYELIEAVAPHWSGKAPPKKQSPAFARA